MASCSQPPRSAAKPKPGTSRIPKIARSERRGVGDTQGARACDRFDAFTSTAQPLRKPPGGETEVRMDILTITLGLKIRRAGGWSRIQDLAKPLGPNYFFSTRSPTIGAIVPMLLTLTH